MAAAESVTEWSDTTERERASKVQGTVSSAREQNDAAGGQRRRTVRLADGRVALASVVLRRPRRAHRVEAYLRWSDRGKTVERRIGEVDADTRADNLRTAWQKARARGLLDDGEAGAVSWASNAASRAVMTANRSRDTRPELLLRSSLHRMGLRYRVGARPLPALRRSADVLFPAAKVAVFVDGCFWHGCPDHLRPAKSNREFWQNKIDGTRARDAETDLRLAEAGWTVVRVWEHEDPQAAARRVADTVRAAKRVTRRPVGRTDS